MDDLHEEVVNKIQALENHVIMLKNENQKKDQEINILKYIMVNMQKSLTSEERSLNAIISGLPENDVKVPNVEDMILKTD